MIGLLDRILCLPYIKVQIYWFILFRFKVVTGSGFFLDPHPWFLLYYLQGYLLCKKNSGKGGKMRKITLKGGKELKLHLFGL